MSDVKLLARWSGWCDPCETERPLILTETGERGLRAWLHGVGHEDRTLRLTCAVCGEWQSVDHDEEDVFEETFELSPLAALRPLGARQVIVRAATFSPYPTEPRQVTVTMPAPSATPDATLDMLAEGFDLLSVAS